MGKRNFIIYFALVIISFYMFFCVDIKASDVVIIEKPIANDIIYGQPLYMSKIKGGQSSVEGSYEWKNGLEVIEVGEHTVVAIFTPNNANYDAIEVEVRVKVNPKRVFLKFERELQKKYDQKNILNVPGYIVQGIIDDDVYVSGNIEANVESVLVGENIKVNIKGLELKGENKDNYYLDLSNYTASIHPNYLEKFGEKKDRVDFFSEVYVPINSTFHVDEANDMEYFNKKYIFKEAIESRVMSDGKIIDVNEKIAVKLHVDEGLMKLKRIKIFNLYNGDYKEIKEYTYKDGYLVYFCNGLGTTVIVQKKPNYTWIYVVSSILLAISSCLVIKQVLANRVKINRYKSLKRRKDNGDFEF